MLLVQYSAGGLFRFVDDGFKPRCLRKAQQSLAEELRMNRMDASRASQLWDALPVRS